MGHPVPSWVVVTHSVSHNIKGGPQRHVFGKRMKKCFSNFLLLLISLSLSSELHFPSSRCDANTVLGIKDWTPTCLVIISTKIDPFSRFPLVLIHFYAWEIENFKPILVIAVQSFMPGTVFLKVWHILWG